MENIAPSSSPFQHILTCNSRVGERFLSTSPQRYCCLNNLKMNLKTGEGKFKQSQLNLHSTKWEAFTQSPCQIQLMRAVISIWPFYTMADALKQLLFVVPLYKLTPKYCNYSSYNLYILFSQCKSADKHLIHINFFQSLSSLVYCIQKWHYYRIR